MARRQWFDVPATVSPLSAALLNDLESRKTEVEYSWVNIKDPPYNAVGDNVVDDTVAIQAAIDDVMVGNRGGTVYFPPGDYRVSTLAINWEQPIAVNLVGASMRSVALVKHGVGTTPVIDFSTEITVLDNFSTIRDMRIYGNEKTNHGIQLSRWSHWFLRNVMINQCDRAINLVGAQQGLIHGAALVSNNYGVVLRQSAVGSVRSNLVKIDRSRIVSNSAIGIDVGDCGLLKIDHCDIESNGTSGNNATGGVYIQNTVDDESGAAIISIEESWFEENYGRMLQAYAGDLSLENVLAAAGSGLSAQVYVDGCRMLRAETVHSFGGGTTGISVQTAATKGRVMDCSSALSLPAGTGIYTDKDTAPCHVYRDAVQVIGDLTPTAIGFNQERFDADGLHDTATNNSRITVKQPGKYRAVANVRWELDPDGFCELYIRKNGSTLVAVARDIVRSGTVNNIQNIVAPEVQLAAGDYLEVIANHSAGNDLDIEVGGDYSPEFAVSYVGP